MRRSLAGWRTWFTLRRLIFGLAILAISGVAGRICFVLFEVQRHRVWYRSVEERIIRLADKKPADVSPSQWAYYLYWTWNLHSNWGGFENFQRAEQAKFLEDFDRKLNEKVDLKTIDWIWDQYVEHCRGGRSYSDSYRPTNPDHLRDWFTNQQESDQLEQWLERLRRLRINKQAH
jgi:hypothetical protein